MLAICASAMPYQSNDELPPAVANHLPAHAQDIFREAFNHAWDESVSLRGAQRRSNLHGVMGAKRDGDCFVAALLAMTVY
jgi:cation transport regulator ChaB